MLRCSPCDTVTVLTAHIHMRMRSHYVSVSLLFVLYSHIGRNMYLSKNKVKALSLLRIMREMTSKSLQFCCSLILVPLRVTTVAETSWSKTYCTVKRSSLAMLGTIRNNCFIQCHYMSLSEIR